MSTGRKPTLYLFALLLCMPSPIPATVVHDSMVSVQKLLNPVIKLLETVGEKIGIIKYPHVISQLVNANVDLEAAIENGIPKHIKDVTRIVQDISLIVGAISNAIGNLGPLELLPPVMTLSTAVGMLSRVTKTAVSAIEMLDEKIG